MWALPFFRELSSVYFRFFSSFRLSLRSCHVSLRRQTWSNEFELKWHQNRRIVANDDTKHRAHFGSNTTNVDLATLQNVWFSNYNIFFSREACADLNSKVPPNILTNAYSQLSHSLNLSKKNSRFICISCFRFFMLWIATLSTTVWRERVWCDSDVKSKCENSCRFVVEYVLVAGEIKSTNESHFNVMNFVNARASHTAQIRGHVTEKSNMQFSYT